MKNILKQLVAAAFIVALAAPAIAADEAPRAPTKGTKSYQTPRDNAPAAAETANADQGTSAEDMQNIAPAAGATDAPSETGKSMKEELRLPRKN